MTVLANLLTTIASLPWYLLALTSAVLIAAATILTKHVLGHEHALEFSSVRALFNTALLLPLVPFLPWQTLTWQSVLLLYFIAVMTAAGILYRTKAQRHLQVSFTTPLQNFSPLFLLVISFFFLHETTTPLQLIGVFTMLAGAYLLQTTPHQSPLKPIQLFLTSKHVHYIVFAMIVLSLAQAVEKFFFNTFVGTSILLYLFLLWLFITINFLILEYFRFGIKDILPDIEKDWKWFLTIAAINIVSVTISLAAISQPSTKISLFIPVRRTSAFFVVLIGGKLFKEDNIPRKLLASTLMILGSVLIIL
ncbi:EamA family transporter [Candidatus Woesearchaeota archaeon]|nr:MAG: EamA family transporter [Candidatus Woesearchaeota archaeon]